jgi:hypothetical protein
MKQQPELRRPQRKLSISQQICLLFMDLRLVKLEWFSMARAINGRLAQGDPEDLAGYAIGENGEIVDQYGDLIWRVELISSERVGDQLDQAKDLLGDSLSEPSILQDRTINEEGGKVLRSVETDFCV